MSDFYVLGLDPGFARIGYSVVRFSAGVETPVMMGRFATKKTAKKQNVLAADDNFHRARDIYRFLHAAVRGEREFAEFGAVRAICAESMSFPRNSSAAAKMAMCWGIIAALSQEFDIPVLQVTPQALKKKVCDDASASKEDIQQVLQKRYGAALLKGFVANLAAGDHEHPYDSLGAVMSCLDSDVLRALRRSTL